MALRIIFAGTPAFSVPTLQALIDSEHEVVAVYTQPDRPKGRGQGVEAGVCKVLAQKHAIPVEQPENFTEDVVVAHLQHYQADLMVVVAYGLILPEIVLNTPRLGCVNVHASLLPRWRGAAPIQRAIQGGDEETGVTIMQMDAGLDTGPMLAKATCAIVPMETHASLLTKLESLGAQALLAALPDIEHGRCDPEDQDNVQATYANKLHKSEANIDWSLSARHIDQHIRALHPWPTAQTSSPKGVIRVHMSQYLPETHDVPAGTLVACGKDGIDVAAADGTVRLLSLQLPNQKVVDAQSFFHGQQHWLVVNKCRFE